MITSEQQTNKIPKISIITPVLNAKKTLEKAIKSVISQDYPNKEHIIIDGGSTDGTVDLIRQYKNHIAYWISEPDDSAARATNKGITIATGEIICFLFGDDWFEPHTFHKIGQHFVKNPDLQLISTQVKIAEYTKDLDLRIIRTHHQEKRLQLNLKNVLFHLPLIGGRFFKTSLFTAFGMLREYHNNQQFHANDREILIRLLIESKQPIKQQTLCHHGYTYLCNPNSITMKPKRISFIEKIATEHKDIALHYLQKDTITRKERNQLQGWYINHLFILFIIAFMQLNFKLGAKLLLKCLCYPIKSLHSIYFTLKKLHRNKIAF